MRNRTLRSFLVLLGVAALPALGACWVEPEQPYVGAPPGTTTPQPTATASEPARVAIATGETLESEPGKGAGVFVEYRGDSQWRVWTTCDTLVTSTPCNYKLAFRPEQGARLDAPTMGIEGSGDNLFDEIAADLLRVSLTTTSGVDSVDFRVEPPGSALQLQASLDGSDDSRLIFWVGPDVLHTGAPTNPVIFEPSTP